ncbi:MFS general substrate transporter [Dactylonectria macrodidyma]|uniref:MFS general substrate transporter n=1 Tax=Dactylonectria macrodidyma TaxID=307937 RepID=A0A9P9F4E1_9HYPO|nr:MFS general substrate transporter [Dactylonectria macrodidyma]
MPLMFISYGLQYMDKTLLGAASQFGIIEDLGLYDVAIVDGEPQADLKKFSNVTLMFYWGFFVGLFPASYLAQRFSTGVFCGVSISVWGAITMVTAAVTSYPGMMVLRFFLGFIEATIPAAFSLIVAMWYRKDEQPLRFAIWVSASGLGGVLGTILLWGIGHIQGALHPWQYQFIILGAVTIVWGVIIALVLPNNPVEARFLSMEDKILAVERMRAGQTGIENSQFKPHQVKEALKDFKTWTFVIIAFTCQLVNGAVSGFGVVIISSFGFGQFESVLVAGSVGGVVFLSLLFAGVVSVFVRNQRCNLAFVTTLPLIAGSAIVWKASWTSIGVPLFGFLLLGFFTAPYIMILSLATANTAGYTKKVVTTSLIWGAYCVSNGVAPLLVRTTETAQHYPTLFKAIIPLLVLCVLLVVGLRWYLSYCNRQKEAQDTGHELPSLTAFADMTDKQNPNFRYSY